MLAPNLTSYHQDWDLDLIWPDHKIAVEVTFNTFLTHLNHFQDLKSTNETGNHKAVDSGNKNTAEAAQRPENTNDDEKWPTQHMFGQVFGYTHIYSWTSGRFTQLQPDLETTLSTERQGWILSCSLVTTTISVLDVCVFHDVQKKKMHLILTELT